MTGAPTVPDPPLPWVTDQGPLVYLVEPMTATEREQVDRWIEEPARTCATEILELPDPRKPRSAALAALAERMRRGDDPLFVPVRVVWLPPARDGQRRIRLRHLVLEGNPHKPRPAIQPMLARREPDRCRVVVGKPARLSELRERFSQVEGDPAADGALGDLAAFVARQGVLALQQAESQLIGVEYKTPRLVKEEIVASRHYRERMQRLAVKLGREPLDVAAEAEGYLDEMVTSWGKLLIDALAQLGQFTYERGYERIEYDEAEVARVRAALRTYPGVLLMSHRSNLDAAILPVALRENGLPRTHSLAGINMAFWPIGPLMRRSGVIFIRRSIRDNPVYRAVLREYVGYLVAKRFHLQWSIEGTRSRTGKMLPPKLGLLSYVADAYAEGRADDVVLVPISIAYDQLDEVKEFARYAEGAEKKKEGLAWMVNFIRAQGRSNFGRIYVRYAEPVSMRSMLGPRDHLAALDPATRSVELQKVAFEVAQRMNQATPVTATGLVTMALLAAQGRALTLDELVAVQRDYLDYAERRKLPMTANATRLGNAAGVHAALRALMRHHVVTGYENGWEPVYSIGPDQQLAASFYRNGIAHFFLESAVAELALVGVARSHSPQPLDEFWAQAFELRDVLKFEFFFATKEEFREHVAQEMAGHEPDWEKYVGAGGDEALRLLERIRPITSHTTLRSFLEAYLTVATVLCRAPADVPEAVVISEAQRLGRQFMAQQKVQTRESVSSLLFKTGLQLAANRGLMTPADDVEERRRAFHAEMSDLVDRVHRVAEVARQQVARHFTASADSASAD